MNLKFKKRIVLVLIFATLFIVLVLNIHKIKFALSMLTLYEKQKNEESLIDNPDKTVVKLPSLENPLDSIINANNPVPAIELTQNPLEPVENTDVSIFDPPSTKRPDTVEESKIEYMQIIEEYNLRLQKLRDSFEDELSSLISQGITDFQNGTTSKSRLFLDYMSKGSNLEKSSDNEFYTLLKNIEKELNDNGYDISVINDISEYYESFKNIKKEEIISRGMKHLK